MSVAWHWFGANFWCAINRKQIIVHLPVKLWWMLTFSPQTSALNIKWFLSLNIFFFQRVPTSSLIKFQSRLCLLATHLGKRNLWQTTTQGLNCAEEWMATVIQCVRHLWAGFWTLSSIVGIVWELKIKPRRPVWPFQWINKEALSQEGIYLWSKHLP